MGFQITKKTGISGQEVLQKVLEVSPGGFIIDKTNKLDNVDFVQRGELVEYNEATGKVILDKLAVVHANGSGVKVSIRKGHSIAVGDILSKGDAGGAAYEVSAIDKSDVESDEITTKTSLGAVTKGDVLWLSSESGATSGAFKVTPNGILMNGFKPSSNDAVSVLLRGTVYERRLPGIEGFGGVPTAKKEALSLIIFSQSF